MKQGLRDHWIQVRSHIPRDRREEAEQRLYSELKSLTENHVAVLSFFSFRNEISMHKLNEDLATNSKLLLPKVHEKQLQLYKVVDPKAQCVPNVWGVLEPDPAQCERMDEAAFSLVFVPGLAFDQERHRLGYGKGYYDRLLENVVAQKVGIGFKEQLSPTPLPIDPHDISLDQILLF